MCAREPKVPRQLTQVAAERNDPTLQSFSHRLQLILPHLFLSREDLPRDGDQLRLPKQRQHVPRHEIEAVVLTLLPHGLRVPQRLARARLVVFPQHVVEFLHRGHELGFERAVGWRGRLEAHADAQVEHAGPDDVDLGDLGEDVVEVVDGLEGFDLDHDGGLAVDVFVQGGGGVAGDSRDAGDEAEGGHGAGAADAGAVFGRRDGVASFGDGVDLRDDDGGAGVEGEADGGVVVAGDAEVWGFRVRDLWGWAMREVMGDIPDPRVGSTFTHELYLVNHLRTSVRQHGSEVDLLFIRWSWSRLHRRNAPNRSKPHRILAVPRTWRREWYSKRGICLRVVGFCRRGHPVSLHGHDGVGTVTLLCKLPCPCRR